MPGKYGTEFINFLDLLEIGKTEIRSENNDEAVGMCHFYHFIVIIPKLPKKHISRSAFHYFQKLSEPYLQVLNLYQLKQKRLGV